MVVVVEPAGGVREVLWGVAAVDGLLALLCCRVVVGDLGTRYLGRRLLLPAGGLARGGMGSGVRRWALVDGERLRAGGWRERE